MAKSPAWQRKEGKNPKGGLNAKGRASYNRATGGNLKPPAPKPKTKADAGRKASFCARMKGMKAKLKLLKILTVVSINHYVLGIVNEF